MESSPASPSEVLEEEASHLNIILTFWRERISVEKAYIAGLRALRLPKVATFDKSLNMALNNLNKGLLGEIDLRERSLSKMEVAYKNAFEGDLWVLPLSQDNIALSAQMNSLERRKTAYYACERRTGDAWFIVGFGPLRAATNLLPFGAADQYLSADLSYRQAVVHYRIETKALEATRDTKLKEWFQDVARSVTVLRNLFIEWANVQRDLVVHLSATSRQQIHDTNDISVPIESNIFYGRIQRAFAANLDTPVMYRNFEFESKQHSTPILFGYPIPDNDIEAESHATHVVNAFYRLLDLGQVYSAIGVPKFHQWYKHQHVRIDAHTLEGIWEQDKTNGGKLVSEFLRLGHPTRAWRLLIYFLQRMPEPLLPLNDTELASLRGAIELRRRLFATHSKSWWIRILYRLCNRSTMGETKRRMLATLLRCLKRSRVDGTWTERHSESWSYLLTRREACLAPVLDLFLDSLDIEERPKQYHDRFEGTCMRVDPGGPGIPTPRYFLSPGY